MISWSEIESECGNYREGFVAVFRKYEGQKTDEQDAYGRTVKVTLNSFARHAGIAEATFRRWVKKAAAPTAISPETVRFTDTRDVSGAKKVLADAPLETVERIVSELSPERKRALAAAAGNEYLKARQDYEEKEARLTPSERKEREAAAGHMTASALKATAGFAALGIVAHIEQATDDLREMISGGGASEQTLEQIQDALSALLDEFQVARGMAGLEEYERSIV